MVGLQSLDLPIGVRVPVSQLNFNRHKKAERQLFLTFSLFLCKHLNYE